MVHFEFDKTALGHVLDSVRVGLEALRGETIARPGSAAGLARNGAQAYAHLRRLRSHLQRLASVAADTVNLDLGDQDRDLLASCALYEVGRLDPEVGAAGRCDPAERESLEAHRKFLADLCVRLATRRIESLTAVSGKLSETVQAIHRRVQHSLMTGPTGEGRALTRGLSGDLRTVSASLGRTPLTASKATGLRASEGPSDGLASFDPSHILDPRLRSVLTLDLKAYPRARDAGDHRLALAHLASIVEAATIDFGLANRQRFTLGGSPEVWNLGAILTRLLEQHFTPVNPGALRLFGLAHAALRPAQQLAAPVAVTPAMLEEFEVFAHQILTAVELARQAE